VEGRRDEVSPLQAETIRRVSPATQQGERRRNVVNRLRAEMPRAKAQLERSLQPRIRNFVRPVKSREQRTATQSVDSHPGSLDGPLYKMRE
jgi:hypothetical protein